MRTVSFVGHVDLEVHGGVSPSALALADVDNDGLNELVVGTEAGELYAFKGAQSQPLCRVSDLGLVTAVCCGPLTAADRNCLVVISGDGWVRLFELDSTGIRRRRDQRIPANVKTALLSDVDQDGQLELVVALTDRVVRVYRWRDDALRAISKCELMQQIGNISLTSEADGRPAVLVSQPGAAVVRLRYRSSLDSDGRECHSVEIDDVSPPVKARLNVSCEVLGGLGANTFAISTLDGSLFYIRDNQLCWSLSLHQQLFGLTRLDVTADGSEELLVTSWDGHTFIINQEGQAVQFLFEEPVTAFAAGRLGGGSGSSAPCLAYAALGRVVLFHSVRLPVMVTETLVDMMAREQPWPGMDRLSASELQELYRWCLYGFPAAVHCAGTTEQGESGGEEDRGREEAGSSPPAEGEREEAGCSAVPGQEESGAGAGRGRQEEAASCSGQAGQEESGAGAGRGRQEEAASCSGQAGQEESGAGGGRGRQEEAASCSGQAGQEESGAGGQGGRQETAGDPELCFQPALDTATAEPA